MAKMRKSSKDVKRLRNAIASAKRTATRAQNMGEDVIFTDIRTIKSFKTRKEFNKYLRDIDKFNKKNRYVKNDYGVVFNRNDIDRANKIIKKQNKQRRKNKNKLKNLQETEGGIVTPVKVINAKGDLWQDQMNLFTAVRPININSYTKKSQLKNRLDALERNKNLERRASTFQSNYKRALREQVKQGVISKKQMDQMIKDINSMSPNAFVMWYARERVTKSMFNYTDLTSSEMTRNQKYVMEQFKSGVKSDITKISDSLGVASGRLIVKNGKVQTK